MSSFDNLANTFVVGDIHGCYHTLMNLVAQLPQDANLIFVGDLCDKGLYSKDVIEFVINHNHLCVKGNHEHLYQKYIIDAVKSDIHSPWSSDKRYGGMQCIESYGGDNELIAKHLEWIEKLPTYVEIGRYFITHGFALEFYRQRDESRYYNDFLLNRYHSEIAEPTIDADIINIFGHCVFDEVQVGEKFFGIDTGCSYGGKLTAIELNTHTIYQQPMDSRDSNYKIRELTLRDFDVEQKVFEDIQKLSFDEDSFYSQFDIVSHEVLVAILQKYKEEGKAELYKMQERSLIFPKQLNRVLDHNNPRSHYDKNQ